MTQIELKPCPFCGEAEKVKVDAGEYYAECLGCGALGPDENADVGASELWNRRPEPTVTAALLTSVARVIETSSVDAAPVEREKALDALIAAYEAAKATQPAEDKAAEQRRLEELLTVLCIDLSISRSQLAPEMRDKFLAYWNIGPERALLLTSACEETFRPHMGCFAEIYPSAAQTATQGTWTTEPPSEAGMYWFVEPHGTMSGAEVYRPYSGASLRVSFCDKLYRLSDLRGKWMKIEQPSPPVS